MIVICKILLLNYFWCILRVFALITLVNSNFIVVRAADVMNIITAVESVQNVQKDAHRVNI